ncbi:MAG TPA: hypothetical protein VJ887_05615, partial [Actinomycetota bacterium]|nr:hypothetical protein [Actinomycetota bacterium]
PFDEPFVEEVLEDFVVQRGCPLRRDVGDRRVADMGDAASFGSYRVRAERLSGGRRDAAC